MYVELFASLFGALGTIVASYFAFKANQVAHQTKTVSDEINDAVNHRHLHGTPRLYDMVYGNFNRISSVEADVKEVKQDVKELSNVVSEQQVEINKIENQIGDE